MSWFMDPQKTKPMTKQKKRKWVKAYLVCFLSNDFLLMESKNGLCLTFFVQHVCKLSGKVSKH